jgi:hypothetical protein
MIRTAYSMVKQSSTERRHGTHPRSDLQARTRREKGIHRPIEEAASSWRGRSSVEEKVSSDLENKIAKAVEQEGGRTMWAEERRRE